MSGQTDLLTQLLDEAFVRKSWHGTNLRGSLRGLSARQAATRPGKGRKCIWEHVLHAAYWKYTVRRRLTDEMRGSFPLSGSNWFPLPADPSEKRWREAVRLLEDEHKQLRRVVAGFSPRQLASKAPGSKLTHEFVVRGIALHDVYHTGQIQFIKRTLKSRG